MKKIIARVVNWLTTRGLKWRLGDGGQVIFNRPPRGEIRFLYEPQGKATSLRVYVRGIRIRSK